LTLVLRVLLELQNIVKPALIMLVGLLKSHLSSGKMMESPSGWPMRCRLLSAVNRILGGRTGPKILGGFFASSEIAELNRQIAYKVWYHLGEGESIKGSSIQLTPLKGSESCSWTRPLKSGFPH
jgi:hypothetical protein